MDSIRCDDVAEEICAARTGLDVVANARIFNWSVAFDLWLLLALSVCLRVIDYIALALNVIKRK